MGSVSIFQKVFVNAKQKPETTTTTTTIILSTGHPVLGRQRYSHGERLIPHFVGGIHGPKSLLFSPYPAIPPYVLRTPHPGITDDRV